MTNNAFRSRFAQMAQLGQATGVQIVAIASHVTGNRYTANAMEFAADGSLAGVTDTDTLTVVNLAETPDDGGGATLGTVTAAIDVEGRWVIVARPHSQLSFVAQVDESLGDGLYAVSPMDPTDDGSFEARGGSVNAQNLWEISVSSSIGVEIDSYVLVTVVEAETDPATVAYVFSRAPVRLSM